MLVCWGFMPAPKPSPTTSPVAQSFGWVATGIVILGLAQFLSAFTPSVWTWGIDYWSELALWVRSFFLVIVAACVLPGVPERVAAVMEKAKWPNWSGWAAAAIALALFVALRSRGYSYGDGYSFRSYIGSGEFPSIDGQLALMAGDLVTHWLIYRAAIMPFGGSVELAYSLVSACAGVAALAAIWSIGRSVFPKDRGARWMIVAAGSTSGMAVLWFGHVEAYSLVGAALIGSLACLVRGQTWPAWGLWLLGCAFHLLALAFLPVLIWVTWGRKIVASLSPLKGVVLFLIGFAAWGVAGTVISSFRPGIFVPLVSTADSSYTAFSAAHLADAANLLLLAAPLGLIGILRWALTSPSARAAGQIDEAVSTLAVAAASLWYFSFWVDPLIGAFRDWDLIGAYGIPLSLLGGMLLLRGNSPGTSRPQWVVVGVMALLHTAGFVFTVQSEAKAMERVDRLVHEDLHYSRAFHRGERLTSWSYVLTHLLDRKDLAVDHLRKRSEWEPSDGQSWSNLGSVYWYLKKYDSSAICYERSLTIDSTDARVLEMLTLAYSARGNWPGARRAVERLSRVRTLKTIEWNMWAFSLLSANEDSRADSILSISLTNDPGQREAYYYRGIVCERRSDTTGALENYERAMSPKPDIDDVYLRATKLYQAQQRWADVERVCLEWEANFPSASLSSFFLGVSRIVTRNYAGARDALERSAARDPQGALTQFYLATAYRNLGEPDRAKSAAQKAAALDSLLAPPYLELLYLAADAGDRTGAVAATREYLRRSPGDSGMAYLQQFMEP